MKIVDAPMSVRVGDEWPAGYRVTRIESRYSPPYNFTVECVPILQGDWSADHLRRLIELETLDKRHNELIAQLRLDVIAIQEAIKPKEPHRNISDCAFVAGGYERYGKAFKRALNALSEGWFA
jgi:hypothetical protein